MLETFFKWLVLSSDNPQAVSLTIKSIVLLQVPVFIMFLHQAGFTVTDTMVIQVVNVGASWIGLVLLLVGLVRKLNNALKEKPKAKKK